MVEAGEKGSGQRNNAYFLPSCLCIMAVLLTLHFNSGGLTQAMDCALMQLAAESKLKEVIIRYIL